MMRIAVSFFVLLSSAVQGQTIDPDRGHATDVLNPGIFNENPALPHENRTTIGTAVTSTVNKNEVATRGNGFSFEEDTEVNQQTADINADFQVGAGMIAGVGMRLLDSDTEGVRTDTNGSRTMIETSRGGLGSGKVAMAVSDSMRIGLMLRYLSMRHHVAGSYFVSSDDRTKFTSTLTGFAGGAYLGNQDAGFGVSYYAPMRGKADVHGESLIITEPGRMRLNLGFRSSADLRFGFTLTRWSYVRDDRAEETTSLVNQTEISLKGINFERQFLFPSQSVAAGLDYQIGASTLLRVTLASQQDVFIFDPDEVPTGSDEGDDQFFYQHYRAALLMGGDKAMLEIGLSIDQRQHDWRYDNFERDYKADDRQIYASIGMDL